jgi:hypothetical protein
MVFQMPDVSIKFWNHGGKKEYHLFVDILQVIAGQRSRVDKEAFKKYMRNMKHVYDAHKVLLTLRLNQPVIVFRIKSIIIMMHQCLRNRVKMTRTVLSIQRRAQRAKKTNRKWSLWMIKDDLGHFRILVYFYIGFFKLPFIIFLHLPINFIYLISFSVWQ